MTKNPLNPRFTIVVVFAFLFIVALFMAPGGAVDETAGDAAEVARSEPMPVAKPAVRPSATPKSWFGAETQAAQDEPPSEPLIHGEGPAPAAPAPAQGSLPVVDPNPPPQGPDFPENH